MNREPKTDAASLVRLWGLAFVLGHRLARFELQRLAVLLDYSHQERKGARTTALTLRRLEAHSVEQCHASACTRRPVVCTGAPVVSMPFSVFP